MKSYLSKLALIGLLFVVSCTKKDVVFEEALPTYNNAFILSLESDKTAITFLDENQLATQNVHVFDNAESTSFSSYNNELYIVSQNGPSYISKVNTENLEVEESITSSNVSSPSYLQMYSKTDGLVINTSGSGRNRNYNLCHVNTTTGIGDAITDVSNKILFNNSALILDAENVLIADGKELVVMNITTKEFTSAITFDDAISGLLKDKNGSIWVAKEKRATDATFTKLNANYSINETVTVTDTAINLFKNSILTMNSESTNAFWSESASGKIYTFDTETKVIEEFATPINEGIALNTVVKQHPKTKQVYVIGLEDFMDPDNSVLVIYNLDKTVANTVTKVGASPIDLYFSDKEFIN
ncbi:DUF5074 domain-containing protein [Polaribacter atrinae]|uniref:Uncharacterized protein n=1 Tax=Polaribacter atrinae TaxID=1333662 RepID=A0A176TF55_9FLAO|nr:hypothetical protein [Polaribacter atrinae]OAD46502.1 hypothetical protein LPB303_02960 [Polaribacter atrinae]